MKQEKKNKILVILTPGFPKDESDSTCLPMQQALVKALSKIDSQIKVFVLSSQYPFIHRTYEWNGITVTSFNGRNKGGPFKWLLQKKVIHKLKELNAENQIVGMISFWCRESALVGKKFAKRSGVPHFTWILGQDAKKENDYIKKIKPKGEGLIAISDRIQSVFELNHGIKPSRVIVPGVDQALFKPLSGERKIDVLGVGSLIPLKQFDIFIRIIATLKKQKPGIRAMIIGKGPEETKLQKLIVDSGLQENIQMMGELPYHEVIEKMKKAKVLLHPSSYEGYSGACMEALAAGVHVISFCKAMNENIAQWHICQSTEEMIQQAERILNDPNQTFKAQSFPIECTAKEFLNLFGD
jgi:glycosyltransferase involved in cell wall biosynthesis